MEISGIELLLFVCLKDSQGKKENLISEEIRFGGDKRDRIAVVCLPERLSDGKRMLDKKCRKLEKDRLSR